MRRRVRFGRTATVPRASCTLYRTQGGVAYWGIYDSMLVRNLAGFSLTRDIISSFAPL